MGCSNLQASQLWGLFQAGTLCGTIAGGFIGDHAAARDPDRGRIKVAIFSVGAGIPLALMPLLVLPHTPEAAWMHGLVLLVFGAVCSWCGSVNASLFSEIVPPHLRSSVFAFDRALEGGLSAFAAPLMGGLTEWFGYTVPPPPVSGAAAMGGTGVAVGQHLSESGGVAAARMLSINQNNVAALSKALSWCVSVPWLICLLTFVVLHRGNFFAQDRNRARALAQKWGEDRAECTSKDGWQPSAECNRVINTQDRNGQHV
jgi:MFS family permease